MMFTDTPVKYMSSSASSTENGMETATSTAGFQSQKQRQHHHGEQAAQKQRVQDGGDEQVDELALVGHDAQIETGEFSTKLVDGGPAGGGHLVGGGGGGLVHGQQHAVAAVQGHVGVAHVVHHGDVGHIAQAHVAHVIDGHEQQVFQGL